MDETETTLKTETETKTERRLVAMLDLHQGEPACV
jgi:hypothetical protein